MAKEYPAIRKNLNRLIGRLGRDLPEPMGGWRTLHSTALADGALAGSTKELIALGIAIAAQCEGCIAYHVHDALRAGVTKEEIVETIGVAVMMGGGPALMYGAEAYEAMEQFQS